MHPCNLTQRSPIGLTKAELIKKEKKSLHVFKKILSLFQSYNVSTSSIL